MPGRELYEFRHPDPNAEVEPTMLYDAFRVIYDNRETPDLVLPEGTVAATKTLLDMTQVRQVWAVKNGYSYLVA
jgi:hypothetical protein